MPNIFGRRRGIGILASSLLILALPLAAQEKKPAAAARPPAKAAAPPAEAAAPPSKPAEPSAKAATSSAQSAASAPEKAAAPPPAKAAAPPCADCAVHVVTKGEGLNAIALPYLDRTSYLTLPELEAAIYQVNGWTKKAYFQPGEKVLIPGLLKSPIVEHPIPTPKTFEVRGIYMTQWTAGRGYGMDLIRRWRAAGGNAVVFDLKDMGGIVAVPFKNPLHSGPGSPSIRSLPKLVHFIHSKGMRAIARIALFRDAYLAEHEPQLDPRSRKTGKPWRENGKQVWVDPSLAAVQDYNLALARQAAESGVDEIQFDYVRFPAEGDQEDAHFAFESEHPKGQRSDVITAFLKRAYAELHPTGVLVSLDVFGVMAWQRPVDLSHTGQDIPQMARYCDVLSPMVYPSHFFGMDGYAIPGDAPDHFISESMKRFRDITADTQVVLRPWLQAFGWRTPDYSPAYVIEQVKVARQEGGIGFMFWNARNDYDNVFPAMAKMGASPGVYFRGDELHADVSATPPDGKDARAPRPASDSP
jgi:hypothetical protein